MLSEGINEIFITFFFAVTGYIGLTITLLLSLKQNIPHLFWRIVSLIILIHVFMVWSYRYDWQFAVSVRNGYSGFLIFHTALLIILLSNFVQENIARILIKISFIVVTTGAVGAVFRYDVVEIYKVPVLIFAVVGSAGLFWSYFLKK